MPNPPSSPPPLPLRHGDPVSACDCPLPGRITASYGKQNGHAYFKVQFPPGSPFLDDWAVYREPDLARRAEKTKPKPKEEAYDDGFPKTTN